MARCHKNDRNRKKIWIRLTTVARGANTEFWRIWIAAAVTFYLARSACLPHWL